MHILTEGDQYVDSITAQKVRDVTRHGEEFRSQREAKRSLTGHLS